MIVITRRLRRIFQPQETEENLDQFRKDVRQTLNKPFKFEPKTEPHLWEMQSSDPLVGFFKPFSKVASPAAVVEEVKEEITHINWRRLALPLGLALAALATFVIWQSLATLSSFQGIISPLPEIGQVTAPAEGENQSIVPPGTELEPGGPFTGTGGPEPAPSGSGSLDPAFNSSTNLTGPSGSGGGVSGSGQLDPLGTINATIEPDIKLPNLGL